MSKYISPDISDEINRAPLEPDVNRNIACDMCGLPSDVAFANKIELELQANGKIICSVCKQVAPMLNMVDDAMARRLSNKINHFSHYIDASAAMFELDDVAVSIATMAIMLRSVDGVAEANKTLALKMAERYIVDIEKLRDEITKLGNKADPNTEN